MSGILRDGSALAGPARLVEPPGRNRVYLVSLLLLLLCGLLAWWLSQRHDPQPTATQPTVTAAPVGLTDRSLAGPRGPACIRLVVGLDVSGSMQGFAVARDTALAQLITWSRKNLRANDELAVVDFAEDAAVRTPPTRMDKLAGAGGRAGANDGTYTNLDPMLRAMDGFRGSACDTELVLISDAQLGDLPTDSAAGQRCLLRHHIHDVRLLVPGDDVDVPQRWSMIFPEAYPTRFDGTDPDATALAFGQAIAQFTGQKLK